jgi:hypothetical protein
MHEYRQVLVRMRRGDSDREIARSDLMGRAKSAALRATAAAQGWLAPDRPLPDDATLAGVLATPGLLVRYAPRQRVSVLLVSSKSGKAYPLKYCQKFLHLF